MKLRLILSLLNNNHRLLWKQGVCHLIEDTLSAQIVFLLYQLGPHYTGSFQAANSFGKQAYYYELKFYFKLKKYGTILYSMISILITIIYTDCA